jgi:hypothetical protein
MLLAKLEIWIDKKNPDISLQKRFWMGFTPKSCYRESDTRYGMPMFSRPSPMISIAAGKEEVMAIDTFN